MDTIVIDSINWMLDGNKINMHVASYMKESLDLWDDIEQEVSEVVDQEFAAEMSSSVASLRANMSSYRHFNDWSALCYPMAVWLTRNTSRPAYVLAIENHEELAARLHLRWVPFVPFNTVPSATVRKACSNLITIYGGILYCTTMLILRNSSVALTAWRSYCQRAATDALDKDNEVHHYGPDVFASFLEHRDDTG